MSNRVMVVVAHPDDESFWMGGTISKLARNGADVRVLALSDGVSSRAEATLEDATQRQSQFSQACSILGASRDYVVAFPDQQSDLVPQISINRIVARFLDGFNPGMVYTHHVGDLNLDHRRVAEAVFVWARGRDVELLSMRPEWPDLCVSAEWLPNYAIDLDDDAIERKAAACGCYLGEVRPYPHPRSLNGLYVTEAFIKIQ